MVSCFLSAIVQARMQSGEAKAKSPHYCRTMQLPLRSPLRKKNKLRPVKLRISGVLEPGEASVVFAAPGKNRGALSCCSESYPPVMVNVPIFFSPTQVLAQRVNRFAGMRRDLLPRIVVTTFRNQNHHKFK